MPKKSIFTALLSLFLLCPSQVLSAALAAPLSADEILQSMAQRTASLQTLYATFTQEKKLTVLTQPLISEGYMCVEKTHDAKAERLVWAYTKPQESGFASVNGKSYHWNGSPKSAKPAAGPEAMALKTVSEHISAWVKVDPTQLRKLYTVRSGEQDGSIFLLLEPKQKQNFFSSLKAVLNPQLDGVQELVFTEKNNDTMRIVFTAPKRNEPLPAPCIFTP